MACTPHWNIVITLQLRYIARATHWRYTVITLKLRYIARDTHRRYTVITLQLRYIARTLKLNCTYLAITLQLRYIAHVTHWRYTVITLKSRYIARAAQVSYIVITLQFHLGGRWRYLTCTPRWNSTWKWRYLARAAQWNCSVISMPLRWNSTTRATLHALDLIASLEWRTMHSLHQDTPFDNFWRTAKHARWLFI